MQPTYIVYMHTFKTSAKSYIGVTGEGIALRLHKHFLSASRGSTLYFHRAIRKYGLEDLKSKILWEGDDEVEAYKKEKQFITEYKTFGSAGYNLTEGGVGGAICSKLPLDRRIIYQQRKSLATTGMRNPNHSGYTDEQIINYAVDFFLQKGNLIISQWLSYCREIGLPVTYSKCRFGGGTVQRFLVVLKQELEKRNILYENHMFVYDKTDEGRRTNISKAIKGRKWYNDGTRSWMIYSDNTMILERKLKLGMIKKCLK